MPTPCVDPYDKNFQPRNDYEELVLNCCMNLQSMYETLTGVWSAGSGVKAARYGRLHLSQFDDLFHRSMESKEWQTCGYVRWRLYPKHHMFLHVLEDQITLSGICL